MGDDSGTDEAGSLRRRWAEKNDAMKDEYMEELTQYFKANYSDDDRTILGLDGCKLFCFFYILVAGVIGNVIVCALYVHSRDVFPFFTHL